MTLVLKIHESQWHSSPESNGHDPLRFTTKGDAQRWLSAVETDTSRGEWHDPRLGDLSFAEWADRWMATKAPNLEPSTVDLYRYPLRKHVTPRLGPMPVGRITTVEVQAGSPTATARN